MGSFVATNLHKHNAMQTQTKCIDTMLAFWLGSLKHKEPSKVTFKHFAQNKKWQSQGESEAEGIRKSQKESLLEGLTFTMINF